MTRLTILIAASCLALPMSCSQVLNLIGLEDVADSMEELQKLDNLKFTPPEEYVLGRLVTATVLEEFRPYSSPNHPDPNKQREIGSSEIERYVSSVGRTLAMASDRPETFTGYRFLVLDSPEINAFAVPSGYIFITTGIMSLMETEEELAGVLAHEISHVVEHHPTRAVAEGLRKQAVAEVMQTATEEFTDGESLFAQALSESIDKSFETSYNGYGRRLELEADVYAVRTMIRAGYDPTGLTDILGKLTVSGGAYPDPSKRVADVGETIDTYASFGVNIPSTVQSRTDRWKAVKAKIDFGGSSE